MDDGGLWALGLEGPLQPSSCVRVPVLSFGIQNTDENKDGWHVAMPTPLHLLMAVPRTPAQALPVAEDGSRHLSSL